MLVSFKKLYQRSFNQWNYKQTKTKIHAAGIDFEALSNVKECFLRNFIFSKNEMKYLNEELKK